jgi:uncharacterized protein YdaU (DUF1376 family)
MLDWCYLHEKPLPKNKDEIARMIRMRTHSDCIAVVLRDFFTKNSDGEYIHKRVFLEIEKANAKSSKARESAKARWDKVLGDANALRTESEGNATQDTLPITQDTLPKKKRASPFTPPKVMDVSIYCTTRNNNIDPQAFIDHYEANGWMRGKTKIKDWKACVRTWEKTRSNNNGQNQQDSRSRTQRVSDKLREIAIEDVRENGFTEKLD